MKHLILLLLACFISFATFAQVGPITGTTTCYVGSTTNLSDATAGGTWSCINTFIATVVGGVVTGVMTGTTTIYYSTSSGSATDTITVIASICPGTTTPIAAIGKIGCTGDTLNTSNYGGAAYQWQQSADNYTWSTMPGATTATYVFNPILSDYYRCTLTCVSTSVVSYTNSSFTPASNSNILYCSINIAPDTVCNNSLKLTVSTCGSSTGYNVTTYYGDGTSTNVILTGSGMPSAIILHNYSIAGTYTIKQVLYNGTTSMDSTTFSYQYLYCSCLPVKFYNDLNHDCIFDAGDVNIFTPINIEIDSNGIAIDTLSATGGFYYKALGGVGTIYGFRKLIDSFISASCPASGILYDTIQSYVNNYPVKYFGLNCAISSAFDLAVNAVIPVTGVNDEWGQIYVQNNYCLPTNGTLTLHYSPKYAGTPSQITPAAASVTGNTIVWDLSSLTSTSGPVPIHYSIWKGSTLLTVGDTVISWFQITPIIGDADTTNNTEIIVDTVRAGCDPNEMSVSPAGCLVSGASANQLQYTIAFMNVGNDTAFNIYAMDTLSPNVNPKSLQIVMASNVMNTTIFNDGTNNIVKFEFPAINLLDSMVCPQCAGAVIFNVNTLPGLANGTTILNHAGVFFDYNPVVMTNTVENIIGGCPTKVPTLNNMPVITIYPNPANNTLNIFSTDKISSITISNLLGQTVFKEQDAGAVGSLQVNVAGFPAGVYFVKINGATVRKFVKE